MNQIAIELPDIASHRSDPSTSDKAEESVKKSGKMHHQCEQVYRAIVDYPNCTAGELAKRSGIDYSIIQRRVSILAKNGLIKPNHQTRKRICSVKGTKQKVLESAL